jgi:aromatic-L-amino-acid/L-tryptophan decarboxylase
MTPEDFRKQGHALIDWLADYRATLESRPVMSQVQPGDIKALFSSSPPQEPIGFNQIFSDLDEKIVPGLSLWQHPKFFGYFPANAPLESVLGDFLSTGLGVLGLAWQSSPALTELEEVVTDWLRQMVGLSSDWQGVIQDTASTSSLIALLCAREKSTNHGLSRGGLQSEEKPLVVYGSAHAHSSIDKAALLAGFGRDNVRYVEVDEKFEIRPEALEHAILTDLERGLKPCAIVASTGTTTTTAFDPLEPLGEIAKKYGVWFHVDAAMAGSAMILPEMRHLWAGVEAADSIVMNPHKWLGAAFDCTAYYVRDPEHLVRVMSTNPSYLQTNADGRVKNYRDWGIPLGRKFRALKLYTLILEQGVSGLQSRLRRDLENAKWLEAQVLSAPGWKVLAPVALQTVCVRYEPAGMNTEDLDTYTKAWCEKINQSGAAYLTPATLEGRWMVRVSIGAIDTGRKDVAELWQIMQKAVLSHEF